MLDRAEKNLVSTGTLLTKKPCFHYMKQGFFFHNHSQGNHYCSLCFKEAPINSRNNGCGRFGLEINSGWNCDATNHG
jgi:hypothetical protein